MNANGGDTAHEMFNKRFDAIFGEDCHDSSGHLLHIHKGKHGLGLICLYLSQIDWVVDDFLLDIVEIKLQRLLSELKIIRYAFFFSIPQTADPANTFVVNLKIGQHAILS